MQSIEESSQEQELSNRGRQKLQEEHQILSVEVDLAKKLLEYEFYQVQRSHRDHGSTSDILAFASLGDFSKEKIKRPRSCSVDVYDLKRVPQIDVEGIDEANNWHYYK